MIKTGIKIGEKNTMTTPETRSKKYFQGTLPISVISVIFIILLLICTPAAAGSSGEQITESVLILSLCELSVTTDAVIGDNFTIDGISGDHSVIVTRGGSAVIDVPGLPAGYMLNADVNGKAEIIPNGRCITVRNILDEKVTVSLTADGGKPAPALYGDKSTSDEGCTWMQAPEQPPESAEEIREPVRPAAEELPTNAPKSAVPAAGLLAGLGTAGVLFRFRRK